MDEIANNSMTITLQSGLKLNLTTTESVANQIISDNNAARQLIINGLSDMGIDVPASAIDGAQIMMGGNSSNGLDITALSTSEDDVVDGTVQETPPKTKSSKPKGFQWTTSSVLALIDCFQSNKENFESSCIRKKTAWKMVAAMMVTKGCLDMTVSQCDEKWRSLKHRYKTICDSKAKTGRGKRKWELFDAMDDVMCGDPAVVPLSLVSTMPSSRPTVSSPVLPAVQLDRDSGSSSSSEVSPAKDLADENEEGTPSRKKSRALPTRKFVSQQLQEETLKKLDTVVTEQKRFNCIQEERNNLLREFNSLLKSHLDK